MPKQIIAYQCEFCGGRKILKTMGAAVYHESRCMKNPALRTCRTCFFNTDHITHIDAEGVYHVEGYDCVEDHRPDGEKIVFNCEHWVDKYDDYVLGQTA